MDADKVQTSTSGDAMLRLISKIDLIEHDIVREMTLLEDTKCRIIGQIEALSDDRYKTLLTERYVFFDTWEQIATSMGYQLKWYTTCTDRRSSHLRQYGKSRGVKQESFHVMLQQSQGMRKR